MKITIRDSLFLMAIIGLGVSFAIHRSAVRKDIERLQLNMEHSIAGLQARHAIAVVDENFRQAELGFLLNKSEFYMTTYSGTFEYEFIWFNDHELPVRNDVFADLIRPITEELYGYDGRFSWNVETTPDLKTIFSVRNPEPGKIRFDITYVIPSLP